MFLSKQKKFAIIFSLIAVGVVFTAREGLAAGLVPCGGVGEAPCQVSDIFVLIARVTNWLLRFAGLYAVYQIIGAGFWLIVSQGNEEKISSNKAKISNAIVGLVLALMAYLFVNTAVNLILLQGVKKCKIELSDPLNYININTEACKQEFDAQKGNIIK